MSTFFDARKLAELLGSVSRICDGVFEHYDLSSIEPDGGGGHGVDAPAIVQGHFALTCIKTSAVFLVIAIYDLTGIV